MSDMTAMEPRRYFQVEYMRVALPARASVCDLIGVIAVRLSWAGCEGPVAEIWGKGYIQGLITHSGASLLAVGRCKNFL